MKRTLKRTMKRPVDQLLKQALEQMPSNNPSRTRPVLHLGRTNHFSNYFTPGVEGRERAGAHVRETVA